LVSCENCAQSGTDEGDRKLQKVLQGGSLDDSQLSALRATMTKGVALIHGFPATGKTHVGLLATRALLDGAAQSNKAPVLVVCSTSHTLDHFLNGILAFETRVVRVGSRSQPEALRTSGLGHKVLEGCADDGKQSKAWKALSQQQKELGQKIKALVSRLQQYEPTADDLEDACTTAQIMSMCAAPDGWLDIEEALEQWLQPVRAAMRDRDAESLLNADGGKKRLVTSETSEAKTLAAAERQARAAGSRKADWAAVTRIDDHAEDEEEEDQWEHELLVDGEDKFVLRTEVERMVDDGRIHATESAHLRIRQRNGDNQVEWPEGEFAEYLLEHDELWQLPATQREQLCLLWMSKKFEELHAELADLCERYDRVSHDKDRLAQQIQLQVLKRSAVIGVTTNALAKLSPLLMVVGVEAVVVEEAAEVLESHLMVALSSRTRHLVLIGDHQQLRPGIALSKLSQQLRLHVSMFERLMKNSVEHVRLSVQWRMRSQMSQLLRSVYPALVDHASTQGRAAVRGVEKPIYFLRHSREETSTTEVLSRESMHEARFMAALAAYLLRQGYSEPQITLLTPYCGQVHVLKRECQNRGICDMRISSVGQYEGEESEIILLSLVRSAQSSSAKTPSCRGSNYRICTALARARLGLFAIGHSSVLAEDGKLGELVQKLTQEQLIGNFLPLTATRGEAGRSALVRSSEDFDGVATEYERKRTASSRK